MMKGLAALPQMHPALPGRVDELVLESYGRGGAQAAAIGRVF